jgi:hypothetical protein
MNTYWSYRVKALRPCHRRYTWSFVGRVESEHEEPDQRVTEEDCGSEDYHDEEDVNFLA